MAYDEELAHRIREALQDGPAYDEKRMFGGLAFLVGGHMAVAASGRGVLLARIDPAEAAALVDDVHVRRMVMRGRAMDGWLQVDTTALKDDDALRAWVDRGVAYVGTLAPKG